MRSTSWLWVMISSSFSSERSRLVWPLWNSPFTSWFDCHGSIWDNWCVSIYSWEAMCSHTVLQKGEKYCFKCIWGFFFLISLATHLPPHPLTFSCSSQSCFSTLHSCDKPIAVATFSMLIKVPPVASACWNSWNSANMALLTYLPCIKPPSHILMEAMGRVHFTTEVRLESKMMDLLVVQEPLCMCCT